MSLVDRVRTLEHGEHATNVAKVMDLPQAIEDDDISKGEATRAGA